MQLQFEGEDLVRLCNCIPVNQYGAEATRPTYSARRECILRIQPCKCWPLSIDFYIERIRQLWDLTLSCFMFSPWPDLQAYQSRSKIQPTFRYWFICFCRAVHNMRDGRPIANKDRLGVIGKNKPGIGTIWQRARPNMDCNPQLA